MSKKAFEAIWTLLDDLNRDQLTELGNEIHQRLHSDRSRQRINIELTQGGLNEGYIQLGDQVNFFPRDSVGGQNVKLGRAGCLPSMSKVMIM